MHARTVSLVRCLVLALSVNRTLAAQESDTELAKKTQNPVADLVSVPFQNNFNFDAGSKEERVWIMNVQPVILFNLTDHWNLITRTIMPIINQPSLVWRRRIHHLSQQSKEGSVGR